MADLVLSMPDRDWLFAEFSATRQQLTDQHQRLRSDMTAGFDRLRDELKEHADDDLVVANRVLTIETQRAIEATVAVKRGAWAGLFAAFGLGAAWELLKFYVHFGK